MKPVPTLSEKGIDQAVQASILLNQAQIIADQAYIMAMLEINSL